MKTSEEIEKMVRQQMEALHQSLKKLASISEQEAAVQSVVKALVQAGEKHVEQIEDRIGALGNGLSNACQIVKETLVKTTDETKASMGAEARKFSQALADAGAPRIRELSTVADRFSGDLSSLGESIRKQAEQLDKTLSELNRFPFVETLKEFRQDNVQQTEILNQSIARNKAALDTLGQTLDALSKRLGELSGEVDSCAQNVRVTVDDRLTKQVASLQSIREELLARAGVLEGQVSQQIGKSAEDVLTRLEDVGNLVRQLVAGLSEWMQSQLDGVSSGFIAQLQGVEAKLQSSTQSEILATREAAQGWISGLGTRLDGMEEEIRSILSGQRQIRTWIRQLLFLVGFLGALGFIVFIALIK